MIGLPFYSSAFACRNTQYCSITQLHSFFRLNLIDNHRCSCGSPFLDKLAMPFYINSGTATFCVFSFCSCPFYQQRYTLDLRIGHENLKIKLHVYVACGHTTPNECAVCSVVVWRQCAARSKIRTLDLRLTAKSSRLPK